MYQDTENQVQFEPNNQEYYESSAPRIIIYTLTVLLCVATCVGIWFFKEYQIQATHEMYEDEIKAMKAEVAKAASDKEQYEETINKLQEDKKKLEEKIIDISSRFTKAKKQSSLQDMLELNEQLSDELHRAKLKLEEVKAMIKDQLIEPIDLLSDKNI